MDVEGNCIDLGFIEVVFDVVLMLNILVIMNGVFCINCYCKGMIFDFCDEVCDLCVIGGLGCEKVFEIYLLWEEMDWFVEWDEVSFL